MTELASVVGVGDLQLAALAEARRIMKLAKGDRIAATRIVFDKLQDLGLISDTERDVLADMHERGMRVASDPRGKERTDASAAYFRARETYNGLLASGKASQVALALAAGDVGSYEPVPDPGGSGGVVYAKNNRSYTSILGGAGAAIGSAWGPIGAGIGGAIGTVVGTIVDDCKD
jgi:hypothetical protein